MRVRLLCISAALLLAGCDTDLLRARAPDIGPRLDGEQIRATLSGNSIVTDGLEDAPLAVFFSADGEMRGLRSYKYRDVGTWKISDDALCGDWRNWWGTMDRCWQVHRAGNRITFRRVGSEQKGVEQGSATLVTGDAIAAQQAAAQ